MVLMQILEIIENFSRPFKMSVGLINYRTLVLLRGLIFEMLYVEIFDSHPDIDSNSTYLRTFWDIHWPYKLLKLYLTNLKCFKSCLKKFYYRYTLWHFVIKYNFLDRPLLSISPLRLLFRYIKNALILPYFLD